MSHVADIILVTMIDDGGEREDHTPNANRLSDWLAVQHGLANRLVQVNGLAGGNKVMQCDVFVCATNYLAIEDFVREFRAIPWQYPESAQLFIKNEGDDAFTVYTVLERGAGHG
jgi:hypothetical protein